MQIHVMSFVAIAIAGPFAAAAMGQAQKDPNTVRDSCYKAAPGKNEELRAFMHNTVVPVMQAEVDAGEMSWWAVLDGVVPAGESAKCDFRVVSGYAHRFPEFSSREQVDGAIKRAKVNASLDELNRQRNALSRLVASEYWVAIDTAGTEMQKGNMVRLNHYAVKPNSGSEWARLETTYWKRLVETWTKAGNKAFWGVYRLWMPQGDSQPYNAATVDIFPDWNSMVHGANTLMEQWPKVVPGTDATEVFDRLDRVRSRHDIEILRVVELVRPSNAAGK